MHIIILMVSFFEKNKIVLIFIAALVVFAMIAVASLMRIEGFKKDVSANEAHIVVLNDRIEEHERAMAQASGDLAADIAALLEKNETLERENGKLAAANEGLKTENGELSAANDDLAEANDELTVANGELTATVSELKTANDKLTATVNELEKQDGGRGTKVDEKFKITYYTTEKSYSHLIPGKTIAMNDQQVADLGLKKGDEIYVISSKGWSGYYTITDHGCAYGIIDIYVERADIPSWGVEYDVEIMLP